MNDADAMQRARAGDRQALGELLRAYQQPLFRYLTRLLGHAQDAEDATQNTFIRVMKSLENYKEQGQFKAWLYRIAHREGLKVLRARSRMPISLDRVGVPEPAIDAHGAAAATMRREDLDRLEGLISGLPAAEREVVHLRMVDGLTFKEIAGIMDCPLGTALGRMRNAVKRLQNMWEGVAA
jgi:RNA polymerase sigma-70 factor (ECF subfamily)